MRDCHAERAAIFRKKATGSKVCRPGYCRRKLASCIRSRRSRSRLTRYFASRLMPSSRRVHPGVSLQTDNMRNISEQDRLELQVPHEGLHPLGRQFRKLPQDFGPRQYVGELRTEFRRLHKAHRRLIDQPKSAPAGPDGRPPPRRKTMQSKTTRRRHEALPCFSRHTSSRHPQRNDRNPRHSRRMLRRPLQKEREPPRTCAPADLLPHHLRNESAYPWPFCAAWRRSESSISGGSSMFSTMISSGH